MPRLNSNSDMRRPTFILTGEAQSALAAADAHDECGEIVEPHARNLGLRDHCGPGDRGWRRGSWCVGLVRQFGSGGAAAQGANARLQARRRGLSGERGDFIRGEFDAPKARFSRDRAEASISKAARVGSLARAVTRWLNPPQTTLLHGSTTGERMYPGLSVASVAEDVPHDVEAQHG